MAGISKNEQWFLRRQASIRDLCELLFVGCPPLSPMSRTNNPPKAILYEVYASPAEVTSGGRIGLLDEREGPKPNDSR
jgi:hypothetical protein